MASGCVAPSIQPEAQRRARLGPEVPDRWRLGDAAVSRLRWRLDEHDVGVAEPLQELSHCALRVLLGEVEDPLVHGVLEQHRGTRRSTLAQDPAP